MDDREMLREKIALAKGFQLYHSYGEEQAAAYIGVDLSTIKRWRKHGWLRRDQFQDLGPRIKRYNGYQIADIIIDGVRGG